MLHTRNAFAIAALATATLGAASTADAQFARVSLAHDGAQPNQPSQGSALSANGRFAAFSSFASNLVPNDTNNVEDVFVRDLVNNTIERVSVGTGGVQAADASGLPVAMSDDGNLVFFVSLAALVAEDTAPCAPPAYSMRCADIYVHDRAAQTTTLLTRGLNGQPANHGSTDFSISADGRFVAFTSRASNLVEHDTNDAPDVFLLDRTTQAITRVSVGYDGAQSPAGGTVPAISADGSVIAFTSASPLTLPAAYCQVLCANLYIKTTAPAYLDSVPFRGPANHDVSIKALALDATGLNVAVRVASGLAISPGTSVGSSVLYRLDRSTSEKPAVHSRAQTNGFPTLDYSASITRDGRYLAFTGDEGWLHVYDHLYGSSPVSQTAPGGPASFSANGRYIAFPSNDTALVSGDTNTYQDVYRYDRDVDNDGLPNLWEARYGLNANDPADAMQDPDNDGLTNLQELDAAGHPNAPHRRYFAEGVSKGIFETSFALLNPGPTDAEVVLRLFADNGVTRGIAVTVKANRRATVPSVFQLPWGSGFATVVESNQPVVVDRLMEWHHSASGEARGSSLETSVAEPATSWFFAEGATGNGFSLYYLLGNLSDTPASVTIDYLRQAPLAPLSETITLLPHSRLTLDVASRFPELLVGPVSARVTSDLPIVAERAMYYGPPPANLEGGHAGAGITAAAPRWFLAEGATGFFDEYVLVANPSNADTDVKFTFLPENGASFDVTRTVAANSRYTLDVKEFPQLAATSVSVIAESTNHTPIVVERAMWWPAGVWYEGSLSAGVTATGTKWAVAEGRIAHNGYSTYILVANTDPARDGQVKVKLLFDAGDPIEVTLDVPRMSRRTLDVGSVVPANVGLFVGAVVESVDDLPIVVERSLYTSVAGRVFNAGGTSVATNITPAVP